MGATDRGPHGGGQGGAPAEQAPGSCLTARPVLWLDCGARERATGEGGQGVTPPPPGAGGALALGVPGLRPHCPVPGSPPDPHAPPLTHGCSGRSIGRCREETVFQASGLRP